MREQAKNTVKTGGEELDVQEETHKEMLEEIHFLEKRMAKIKRYLETNPNKNNRQ